MSVRVDIARPCRPPQVRTFRAREQANEFEQIQAQDEDDR